jgi:hypothetical protein
VPNYGLHKLGWHSFQLIPISARNWNGRHMKTDDATAERAFVLGLPTLTEILASFYENRHACLLHRRMTGLKISWISVAIMEKVA